MPFAELAIFLAMVVGIAAAAMLGKFGHAGDAGSSPPMVTSPVFTWNAILTATPVMVVLIVLQSNVPSLIFLRSEQYHPPARLLDYVSGLGTMAASFLGPAGISLSLPATAMVAGEEAGPHRYRHRAVVMLGLGPYFWSLVFGVAVSWTLEREGIGELRLQTRKIHT